MEHPHTNTGFNVTLQRFTPEFLGLVEGHIDGTEVHGHAQPAVHHVIVAVLGPKSLVGHLETRGAVHRSVNPRYLEGHKQSGNKTSRGGGKKNIFFKVFFCCNVIIFCNCIIFSREKNHAFFLKIDL